MAAIGFLGFIGTFIFLVLTIFSAARGDGKTKKRFYITVGLLTVSVTSFVIASTSDTETTVQVNTTQQKSDNKHEEALKTIGVGFAQFKHHFNEAGKNFNFNIDDDNTKLGTKTDYIESIQVNITAEYQITMDIDRKSEGITHLVLSGKSKQNEEDIGVLIRLMDSTIAGVDKSLTEDERKKIIGQLGFETKNMQDIWSLDKSIVKNGLAYSFISSKDGEVALSIGKAK
ncbi:hypothetical protein NSQ24_01470 [Brevibacillus sp. FSL L8-0520]|uniref:hypothetical protein n=1 Tax=Brevibacillus sp. FSL L8-0520 TaxID=2954689 RepID=UPI0030D1F065